MLQKFMLGYQRCHKTWSSVQCDINSIHIDHSEMSLSHVQM